MKYLLAALAAVCATTASAETTCLASKQHYDSIRTGMSYADVVSIIGCDGDEMSRTEMAGFTTFMVMWNGSSMGGNMNAMFQNDRLVSKAQFGLK